MKILTSKDRLNELFDSDARNDTAIAMELGVSKQTVSAWRCGTRSPKKPMLIKISELYHVSIEWLMGFDVPKCGQNMDLHLFGESPDTVPKNDDIRLLVRDLSKLSPEQVEQAKEMFRLMFKITNPELFKENDDDDT